MPASAVARAIACGMARGQFLILPNAESRMIFLGSRWVPRIVRAVMDRQVAAVRRRRNPSPASE